MTPEAALEQGLVALRAELGAEARAKLLSYVSLLAKWNKTYNLTAVREPAAMVSHHVLDSLAVAPHLSLAPDASLADVGAGAGVPGIPLAIARPDVHVSLNDANAKKAAFLRQAAMELKLPNALVHEGRVEAWRPERAFDVVISRAFAELRAFVLACRHLVRPGGLIAAMKSARTSDEVRAAADVCSGATVIELQVPFVDAARTLVLCRS
jgi:16S rRNA (guanine527-N7)-methyltransferase